MVAVTILGAGITGMAIASQLPTDYKITIVGKHLPGDPQNFEFASQWAGACWVGVPDSSLRDQRMQLDAFAGLWKIASEHLDSGLRISDVTEVVEDGMHGTPDAMWFASKIPGFRFLARHELLDTAAWGMTYKSVIISPPVFIRWLRARLEARGVEFRRISVESLEELKGMGHDVLVNAAGSGSRRLTDVSDASLIPFRMQSMVIEKQYDQGFIYRGRDGFYFNIFGRPDGTCYLGGIKDCGNHDRTVYHSQRQAILSRGYKVLPDVVPSDKQEDYKLLYDIGTTFMFRQRKDGGTRVEAEVRNGQNIVHAYGQEAGAFTYSFGVARAASELVVKYAYELPVLSHL